MFGGDPYGLYREFGPFSAAEIRAVEQQERNEANQRARREQQQAERSRAAEQERAARAQRDREEEARRAAQAQRDRIFWERERLREQRRQQALEEQARAEAEEEFRRQQYQQEAMREHARVEYFRYQAAKQKEAAQRDAVKLQASQLRQMLEATGYDMDNESDISSSEASDTDERFRDLSAWDGPHLSAIEEGGEYYDHEAEQELEVDAFHGN
jgi:hypothetical protein